MRLDKALCIFFLCAAVAFGSVVVIVIERPSAVAVEPEKDITVTIDSSLVDAALTNFPVRLNLAASSGISATNVTAIFTELGTNYSKLNIRNADGDYLPIEVEWFSPFGATNHAELWVRVPAITNTPDTVLTLHYANTNAVSTNIGVIGSAPGELVWRSDFRAVWHLFESAPQTRLDSTDNSNDAFTNNYDGSEGRAAQIDGGDNLGIDDYLSVDDTASLDFGATDNFSISLWFNLDLDPAEGQRYCMVIKRDGANAGYAFDIVEFSGTRIGGLLEDTDGNVAVSVQTGADIPTNEWHHGVLVVDRTADEMTHYLDGSLYETVKDISNVTNSLANNKPLYIGRDQENNRFQFDGTLDEIRVNASALSAAEVKAAFNSENDSLITYTVN